MARGGSAILLGLFVLIMFTLLIIFLLRFAAGAILPDSSLQDIPDMLWRSFTQIIDAGGIEADEPSTRLNKFIGILSVMLGLVFFSALVAFITNEFTLKVESLRKGKSSVIENGHTLILGFGAQIIEIIEQLILANEYKKKSCVVALSNTDKAVMDDL